VVGAFQHWNACDGISYILGVVSGLLVGIVIFAIVEYNIQRERTKNDIKYYEEMLSVLDGIQIIKDDENGTEEK
jgi:hypothetical protein